MKFVDEAIVEVKAGDGGPGASHFRREKYVPFGGPDGGDGGKGGSVILKANRNAQTLLDFQFRPLWRADNGGAGQGSNRHGADGEDLVITVPVGVQVYDSNGELLADLDAEEREFVLAKGGRGGKGNAFFKSATNQAPTHCQPGEKGTEGKFLLSLKLVADVGLIGFPNAGKSSLISKISAARPKVADYPFTTLVPSLGVVRGKGQNFVVADIPGLIEGAHEGKGLGDRFLKHVERAKVLVHLIDVFHPGGKEGMSVMEAFEAINRELTQFSDILASKKQIVVLSKSDLIYDKGEIAKLVSEFSEKGYKCFVASSATGEGINDLIAGMEELLLISVI